MSDQVFIIIIVTLGLLLLGRALYLLVDFKEWDDYKFRLCRGIALFSLAIFLIFFNYLIK